MAVIKKSNGEWIFDIFNYIFLALVAFVCVAPMWHVLAASLSNPLELMKNMGMLFWPVGKPTLEGYKIVVNNPNIWSGYRNTLIILVLGLSINLFMTTLGGYVLSRRNVLWNKFLTIIIVFTMYFGGGLIPSYLLISKILNMNNTFWAVTIPGAISTYNMIICRTAFRGIPDSLEESARLDGANDLVILYRIIIPLSKSMLAVITLWYAVGHWNSWFSAMLYLQKAKLHPLQLILRQILISNDLGSMGNQEAIMGGSEDLVYMARQLVQYCTIIVATIPILVLYPFLQKYFVKGVMIGSVKE
jgi:putative aldouronate transport system permease protein